MVLINELTVEQINAALLHLQRSKDEVVGGNKGTTIQNISISNSGGGGNNVDYSGTIKNLATNIEKNKTATEKNASDIAKLKSDFSNIEKSVEDTLQGLADNGISDLSFDPLTKQLTITTNDGDIYQTVIEQDISYLSYDSATNKLILTTGNQSQEITLPYIKASEKGSANGVATLDENGRVPYSQLPESAMEFLGQWNASTNTPHLADGTGTNGDFYIVSVGGTVNLGTAQDPHIVTFSINDRVVYEGDIAQWVRLPAGQVSSVNGQSGEVTLTASDIEYSTGVSIKAKIDANAVQSDWNVSDTTSLAYIKNKPTIPASPVQSDWNVTDTTSLAYIKNKPSVAVLGDTAGCGLGTASAGSCATAARSDHVHPLPTLVTCSCYSNQLHGCLTNYNCGLQLAVSGTSIDMYQKQGDTSKNVNINVNGGICQVSLYNGTSNALGTLCLGELNSLGYVTASTGFRSGTGNGYFYTSDGNTLNYSSDYAHMWLNYRGGTCIINIGDGAGTGCRGILCASCFCGTTTCADTANTVDGYHADVDSTYNLLRVIKDIGVGTGAAGYYAGMTNANVGDGRAKWWHILSMDWSGNSSTEWQSQFLLPTQEGGVPKYRRNDAYGTAIESSTWHNFITDENIGSQHVAYADSAGSTGELSLILRASCGQMCIYQVPALPHLFYICSAGGVSTLSCDVYKMFREFVCNYAYLGSSVFACNGRWEASFLGNTYYYCTMSGCPFDYCDISVVHINNSQLRFYNNADTQEQIFCCSCKNSCNINICGYFFI